MAVVGDTTGVINMMAVNEQINLFLKPEAYLYLNNVHCKFLRKDKAIRLVADHWSQIKVIDEQTFLKISQATILS